MQKLIGHIENLLAQHDCVIVPGFGGFVANHEPARVCGNLLLPPSRTLVFNALLTYNDGLLAQNYMRAENVSFQEAMRQVKTAVERLKTALRTEKSLEFGSLGTFEQKGADITFFFNEKMTACAQNYGMKKLFFPPLERKKEPRVEWQTWVAAAVVALLVLLPLNNIRMPELTNADTAAFASVLDELNAAPQPLAADTATVAQDTLAAVAEIMEIPDSVEVEENPAAEEIVSVDESELPYQIIVASLPTMAKARQYEREMADYAFDFTVVQAAGRFRMSVAGFATESEAERFLDTFKQTHREFSSAWIFARDAE